MQETSAKFMVGQLIIHKLFDYRGVIYDVDPCYIGSEEWYIQVARSRPPRDKPWYRILVHNAIHETYVAERNLLPDVSHNPVIHPLVHEYFDSFTEGHYITRGRCN